MKVLVRDRATLKKEGRWDADYHLPPEGIKEFSNELIKTVSTVADIVKEKRDPTKKPDSIFTYVDISSVDVANGTIENPQEISGSEAPSRARKVIKHNDIIISTCRPTRGAIAIITKDLDNQICSTGFSVIRPKKGINPIYLHFALRLNSTLEQFRKWSTGSSYPAILDEDVMKTKIPIPTSKIQKSISLDLKVAQEKRNKAIKIANMELDSAVEEIMEGLSKS